MGTVLQVDTEILIMGMARTVTASLVMADKIMAMVHQRDIAILNKIIAMARQVGTVRVVMASKIIAKVLLVIVILNKIMAMALRVDIAMPMIMAMAHRDGFAIRKIMATKENRIVTETK